MVSVQFNSYKNLGVVPMKDRDPHYPLQVLIRPIEASLRAFRYYR
jgi:hypothetical protein